MFPVKMNGFVARMARLGTRHTYNKNMSLVVGEGPIGMWSVMALCTAWLTYTGYRYAMHPEFRIMAMHEKAGVYGVNMTSQHGVNFRPFFMKRVYPVGVDPEEIPE